VHVNVSDDCAFCRSPIAERRLQRVESFMKRVGTWCAALAIACAVIVMAPARAHAVVGVSVAVAPPAIRERVVVARPGYAWVGGYWRWTGVHHVWVGGYWAPARPGYRYVSARWAPVGPAWRFHAGYWRRW
jgi:hypothetical protein